MKAYTSYYQIGKPNGEIVFACECMDIMECLITYKQRGFLWPSDMWETLSGWDSYSGLPM